MMGRQASLMLLLNLVAGASALLTSPNIDVKVDWFRKGNKSRTITTLQVVSNPILDRELTAPNGTKFKNPIHDQAWKSLADLGCDLVRFVPWFPYPHKSVAELDAPREEPGSGLKTSWKFDDIIPGFYDFMAATFGRGKRTVINFSTQPCWLFKNKDCSYPKNPDQSFFGYVRGDRSQLLDPSAKTMAAYFARLLQWIVLGKFTDEAGQEHVAQKTFNLSGSATGNVWELFNEGEHKYNPKMYTHDYDIIVTEMIKAVGADSAPLFMGVGGAFPAQDYFQYFLNKSNHMAGTDAPVDFVSAHWYGQATRNDTGTYAGSFFGGADSFINEALELVKIRDASDFPKAKIDFDEVGIIMPGDNDPKLPLDGNLPDIYWNAAGAMYAYIFGKLAPQGVEVLGQSQLAGSPKIPEWGIPLPQYPSVSMLDWRTGLGNARYWVLKLLVENIAVGDTFYSTSVSSDPHVAFCADVEENASNPISLECASPDATLEALEVVAGLPGHDCGTLKPRPCDDRALALLQEACLGKVSCSLPLRLAQRCFAEAPGEASAKILAVKAWCRSALGGSSPSAAAKIFALGVASGTTAEDSKRVLLVNKQNARQTLTLGAPASLELVDPVSVGRGSANGIRRVQASGPEGTVTLEPFAVAVAYYSTVEVHWI